MASIKELKAFALTVMANAYQSLPETIKPFGAEIAHYLENNFRLSFETLLSPKRPKTIIVVEYDQKEKISKDEGMDYIVRTLKYELGIPREVSMKAVAVDEPLGLLQVPPLTILRECEGGVVVDDSCAICQQGFSGESDPRKTSCSHVFHRDCIGRWLWTRLSCPICRLQLV